MWKKILCQQFKWKILPLNTNKSEFYMGYYLGTRGEGIDANE